MSALQLSAEFFSRTADTLRVKGRQRDPDGILQAFTGGNLKFRGLALLLGLDQALPKSVVSKILTSGPGVKS